MQIFHRKEIEEASRDLPALMKGIEEGFRLYSEGKVVTPPVGHMHFEVPPGNLHIKYGHIPKEAYFVVKIASHFPENAQKGLSSIQGVLLLCSQKTGELVALFQDHGYLTHLRTGLAGAVVAKYLAPKNIQAIGIVGAGMQARIQLCCLAPILKCRKVLVWARTPEEAKGYAEDPLLKEWDISIAGNLDELIEVCNYIVTTTPSHEPLLFASQLRPGMHITAVGSDSPGKQELDPYILQRANVLVVDSRSQCSAYGETHHALKAGLIDPSKMQEIGEAPRRTSEEQVTVADLTGLAIQDLKIAEKIYEGLALH